MEMRTKEAVLKIAAWQLGVVEMPSGSNRQKYGEAFGMNGQPWCMMFVWRVFHEAGFNLHKTASCTTLTNRHKQAGQWVTSGYKPGNMVMFDFSGRRSKPEHVGIVESISADGKTLTTIEGNTGAVMRRTRNVSLVTGACRPGYNL